VGLFRSGKSGQEAVVASSHCALQKACLPVRWLVSSPVAEVPIIDIEGLGEDPAGHHSVDAIADAASKFGFFQVVGHGIPQSLIDLIWTLTHQFFALPRAEKLAILRTKENSRGFYDRELTKQRRDLKEVLDFATVAHRGLPHDDPRNFAAVDGHNQWPQGLPQLEPTMMVYLGACEEVALRLIGAFAVGMEANPQALRRHFGSDNTSFIRLNRYPLADPLTADEAAAVTELGDMALHHHSDSGALTLLLQDDVGGLQVQSDGVWIDVAPTEGALVVNTGDMMQVWSNDRYKAALHRVTPISDRERYSLPYFFNPSYDTDYAPLDIDAPIYHPINWGTFRQGRADGDFADYGAENQIADYRI